MTAHRLTTKGIPVAEAEKAARAQHLAEQFRLLPYFLRTWGVRPREQRAVMGTVQAREGVRHVRDFAASSAQCLTLWGPTGAGKTVAAVYWLMQAARVRIETSTLGSTWQFTENARFLSVFDLQRIQRSYDPADMARMTSAINARALVFDDLGRELGNITAGLSKILYERHANDRKTVITANIDPKATEFGKRYGDANLRRMLSDGIILGVGRHEGGR